jgi:hypothetical protein
LYLGSLQFKSIWPGSIRCLWCKQAAGYPDFKSSIILRAHLSTLAWGFLNGMLILNVHQNYYRVGKVADTKNIM